ncbi:MAG: FKBP-type peptidyl-prolyl cis-trans isomerase [Pirellulales bacterium]
MRIQWTVLCGVVLSASFALAQQAGAPAQRPASPGPQPQSDTHKASYFFGLNIGRNLKAEGLECDPAWIAQGIVDALRDAEPRAGQQELIKAVEAFQTDMAAKKAERDKVVGAKNQKDGAAFLASNKQRPGVQTTSSGLQYQVVKAGSGAKPKPTDIVQVHYRGTLLDGTEFDSSYDLGKPAEFGVSEVISGWTEALQLMPVGSKWKLVVPAELAYAEHGSGALIGPHATLHFEVELLDITTAKYQQQQTQQTGELPPGRTTSGQQ